MPFISSQRQINFENQDAEYYTMGWLAFCRFLGKIATSRPETLANYPALQTVCAELVPSRAINFEKFAIKVLYKNQSIHENVGVEMLMDNLSMQFSLEKKFDRFSAVPNICLDWQNSPKYRISQKMLDALWIGYSRSKSAKQAIKQYNLTRHQKNIDSLVDYYFNTSDLNFADDYGDTKLGQIHYSLEYYIGNYDPAPQSYHY